MQYNQPYDQPLSPNAGYLNGNPSTGVAGSIPPAAVFEFPQREIVAVIAASGQTPDNGDLQQLFKALRGDILGYFVDQGTPNALVVNPLPAYLGQPANGTRFRVKLVNPITAGATFQVNTNTPLPMCKSGGAALTGGEGFQAGDIVSVTVDSGYAKVTAGGSGSGLIPTGNVVLNVPGQYPTIRAAVIAAGLIFMPPNVYGTIQVAAGYVEQLTVATGPILLTHPFGQRWRIIGAAMTGALPTYADLAGKSNADCLTLLRTRFAVEIRCQGTGAFALRSGVWNLISNILVSGDQTASGAFYGIKVGDWSTEVGMGAIGLLNVWVHGFGLDNIRAELLSGIQANGVGSTYATAHDFHVSHGSVLSNPVGNLLTMYGQSGIILQNGGQLAIDSASGTQDIANHTGPGIGSTNAGAVNAFSSTALRIRGNAGGGIVMGACSTLALSSNGSTLFSGNGGPGDIYLSNASEGLTFGCALPAGCSPARGGTPGNVGATIY